LVHILDDVQETARQLTYEAAVCGRGTDGQGRVHGARRRRETAAVARGVVAKGVGVCVSVCVYVCVCV